MRMVWVGLLMMLAGQSVSAEESIPLGLNCGYWNTALAGDALVVTRVLFVRGVYEGATALHMDIFDAAERAPQAEQPEYAARQAAELFEARYYRKSGYLVLVDGVDQFCKDPQNEAVWLTGAIKIVSMQLRSESEAITVETQRLRAEPGP